MTLEEIDWEAEAAADARDEREDYAIRYVTLCITGPRRQVETETVLLENRMPHDRDVDIEIEKEWEG